MRELELRAKKPVAEVEEQLQRCKDRLRELEQPMPRYTRPTSHDSRRVEAEQGKLRMGAAVPHERHAQYELDVEMGKQHAEERPRQGPQQEQPHSRTSHTSVSSPFPVTPSPHSPPRTVPQLDLPLPSGVSTAVVGSLQVEESEARERKQMQLQEPMRGQPPERRHKELQVRAVQPHSRTPHTSARRVGDQEATSYVIPQKRRKPLAGVWQHTDIERRLLKPHDPKKERSRRVVPGQEHGRRDVEKDKGR